MKKSLSSLLILSIACCCAFVAPAWGATGKRAPAKSSATRKASPAKPAATPKRSRPGAAKAAGPCRTVKLKGGKTRRVCEAAKAEPVLNSPIQNNALNDAAPADKGGEVKARVAPDRAYAVDGETFFYQGRKYRVAGLDAGSVGGDMATQRLQKLLESGSLMIDPLTTDEAGVSTATVRVNGRDVADSLR